MDARKTLLTLAFVLLFASSVSAQSFSTAEAFGLQQEDVNITFLDTDDGEPTGVRLSNQYLNKTLSYQQFFGIDQLTATGCQTVDASRRTTERQDVEDTVRFRLSTSFERSGCYMDADYNSSTMKDDNLLRGNKHIIHSILGNGDANGMAIPFKFDNPKNEITGTPQYMVNSTGINQKDVATLEDGNSDTRRMEIDVETHYENIVVKYKLYDSKIGGQNRSVNTSQQPDAVIRNRYSGEETAKFPIRNSYTQNVEEDNKQVQEVTTVPDNRFDEAHNVTVLLAAPENYSIKGLETDNISYTTVENASKWYPKAEQIQEQGLNQSLLIPEENQSNYQFKAYNLTLPSDTAPELTANYITGEQNSVKGLKMYIIGSIGGTTTYQSSGTTSGYEIMKDFEDGSVEGFSEPNQDWAGNNDSTIDVYNECMSYSITSCNLVLTHGEAQGSESGAGGISYSLLDFSQNYNPNSITFYLGAKNSLPSYDEKRFFLGQDFSRGDASGQIFRAEINALSRGNNVEFNGHQFFGTPNTDSFYKFELENIDYSSYNVDVTVTEMSTGRSNTITNIAFGSSYSSFDSGLLQNVHYNDASGNHLMFDELYWGQSTNYPPQINDITTTEYNWSIGSNQDIYADITDPDNNLDSVDYVVIDPNGNTDFSGTLTLESGSNYTAKDAFSIDEAGEWELQITATDTDGAYNESSTVQTVFSPPQTVLEDPAQDVEVRNPVRFNYTPKCFSQKGCGTASLYLNYTDSTGKSVFKAVNSTTNIENNTVNTVRFNFSTLPDENRLPEHFKWNINVEQSDGQESMADQNRTVFVRGKSYIESLSSTIGVSEGAESNSSTRDRLSDISLAQATQTNIPRAVEAANTGTDVLSELLSGNISYREKIVQNTNVALSTIENIDAYVRVNSSIEVLDNSVESARAIQYILEENMISDSFSERATAFSSLSGEWLLSTDAVENVSTASRFSADSVVGSVIAENTGVSESVGTGVGGDSVLSSQASAFSSLYESGNVFEGLGSSISLSEALQTPASVTVSTEPKVSVVQDLADNMGSSTMIDRTVAVRQGLSTNISLSNRPMLSFPFGQDSPYDSGNQTIVYEGDGTTEIVYRNRTVTEQEVRYRGRPFAVFMGEMYESNKQQVRALAFVVFIIVSAHLYRYWSYKKAVNLLQAVRGGHLNGKDEEKAKEYIEKV